MRKVVHRYIIAASFAAVLFAACSQDQEQTGGRQPLQLEVAIDELTRAATVYNTEGTTSFSNGATIGVSVRKSGETPTAYANNPINIPYTTNGSTWSATNPIMLTIDEADVTAYYPYNSNYTPSAIAVRGSDNVDYMYAIWKSDQTKYTKPSVSLTMKHAQSIIRVSLRSKTNETPRPNVTRLILEGTNYGRSGTLNTTTGTFSNIDNENIQENYTPAKELSTTATIDQWYVVTNGMTSDIKITLFIDGEEYTATWNNITFEQGKIYNFPLTFGTALLKPSPVTIQPWSAGAVGAASTDIHRLHPDETGVWLGTFNEDGKKIYWPTKNLNAGITKGTTYSAQGDYYQWGQYFPRYPQYTTLEETTNYTPSSNGALISEEISNDHTRYAFLTPTGWTNMEYSEWRIPTMDEVEDLLNSHDIVWTTEATGIRATYTATRQSVFFGFTGYLCESGMRFQDAFVCFWTCSRYMIQNNMAWHALFSNSLRQVTTQRMYYAMPIRAIRYEE